MLRHLTIGPRWSQLLSISLGPRSWPTLARRGRVADAAAGVDLVGDVTVLA